MPGVQSIIGNFKKRYGRWVEPLPDKHTLADFGDFIPRESRLGLTYDFPVLTGIEHGQTPNIDGSAFTILSVVDSQVLNATVDGATILVTSDVSYDVIYRSLNGAGNGNVGGAFKTGLDQAVQAMLMGASLYRELALAYGPGAAAAAASNIAVVNASISGANLAAPQVVTISTLSWIPGLWVLAQNMLVDIYQSDGTTLRAAGVTVQGKVGTPLQTRLQLFLAASGATVAAGDVIVPREWRLKSCVGIEAIYNNATTLFGINAALVYPWRCTVFANPSGALTRAKIMGYAAQIALNGVDTGGKLFVSSQTFADLAEEFSSSGTGPVQIYTNNNDRQKEIGVQAQGGITYITSAGPIEVVIYQYAKMSQAFFIAYDNFKRVGSTDLTMKPINGMPEAFLTHRTDKSGMQMKIFSNQAPVFEIPYRNFMVTGIINTTGPVQG